MNGDGADELAVRCAPASSSSASTRGATDDRQLRHGVRRPLRASTQGTKRAGDLFGEAMAMGDFNNDSRADLAVGAPYDSDDTGYSVGAVFVVPGRQGRRRSTRSRNPLEPRPPLVVAGGRTRFTVNDQPGLLRPHARRRQLRR